MGVVGGAAKQDLGGASVGKKRKGGRGREGGGKGVSIKRC